jgi:hypothetical protein
MNNPETLTTDGPDVLRELAQERSRYSGWTFGQVKALLNKQAEAWTADRERLREVEEALTNADDERELRELRAWAEPRWVKQNPTDTCASAVLRAVSIAERRGEALSTERTP